MIAVARSGNNNLCHIVTSNHGERPVPTTRLRPDSTGCTDAGGLHPGKTPAGPIDRRFDAKPVPVSADFD
jgi:hypothetical protein